MKQPLNNGKANANAKQIATQLKASQSVIGKTVTGLITRPGAGGKERLLVLQFSDGSCFEFVSSQSQRSLQRGVGRNGAVPHHAAEPQTELEQLSFFPHDGNSLASSIPV